MAVEVTEESNDINEFLNSHHIGVLATADQSGLPHAATIYFVKDDDLKIYFITKEETAKCRNLKANPRASLAVYEASSQSTAQISGDVTEVTDVAKLQDTFAKILKISAETSESPVPPSSRLSAGGYVGFCLNPKYVRMAVYTRPTHGQLDQLFSVSVKEDEKLE